MKCHYLLLPLIAFVSVACDVSSGPAVSTQTPISYSAVYPSMNTPILTMGPKFTLQRPVSDGDTTVRGKGPANVAIRIVDASLIVGSGGALVLGTGTIDSSGVFVVNVNPPLIKDHMVGIQIGDLTGTNLKYDDFLRGDGYVDRPMVGTVFDSAFATARP
jgi:hypothetical protein